MFVFIASVHHTGTQFTQKLFEDLGYEPTDKTPKESGNSVNYFHRSHIADSVMTELTEWLDLTRFGKVPLIVPLRHPMEVARSWLARKKPIYEMVRQFQILSELVDSFNPYYLPLDHTNRELYMEHLRIKIDPKLDTNWPIIGGKREGSDHKAQLRPVEPNFEQYKQLEALADCELLKRFYPDRWLL